MNYRVEWTCPACGHTQVDKVSLSEPRPFTATCGKCVTISPFAQLNNADSEAWEHAANAAGNTALARSHGFEIHHTGGGCMAFAKGTALVTWEDSGIEGDPEAPVWWLGFHHPETGEESGDLQQALTLQQAFERGARDGAAA